MGLAVCPTSWVIVCVEDAAGAFTAVHHARDFWRAELAEYAEDQGIRAILWDDLQGLINMLQPVELFEM